MKLDVGGGFNTNVCFPENEIRKDFTVVDKYNLGHEGTIQADAWDIPLENNSVDAIFSSHMLEHMPFPQIMPTLLEWNRILKPSGKLYLHLPDLEYCVTTWLNAPENHPEKWNWFIKIIFGGQEYEGDAHLTGFTLARIQNLLIESNFDTQNADKIWCPIHNQMELRTYSLKK